MYRKTTPEENLSNLTEKQSTACSRSEINTQCTEPQPSVSQPATYLIPDSQTIRESNIIHALIEPVPLHSQASNVLQQNITSSSEINRSTESDVSIAPNNTTCIFFDQ